MRVGNEQCQDVKKQISVLAQGYLFLYGLIGRTPVNEGAMLPSCTAGKSEKEVSSRIDRANSPSVSEAARRGKARKKFLYGLIGRKSSEEWNGIRYF